MLLVRLARATAADLVATLQGLRRGGLYFLEAAVVLGQWEEIRPLPLVPGGQVTAVSELLRASLEQVFTGQAVVLAAVVLAEVETT